MSARNKCGYFRIAHDPTKYNTYLVKTKGGTYEFAHFNQEGWTILGDNKGAIPIVWIEIPTTDLT